MPTHRYEQLPVDQTSGSEYQYQHQHQYNYSPPPSYHEPNLSHNHDHETPSLSNNDLSSTPPSPSHHTRTTSPTPSQSSSITAYSLSLSLPSLTADAHSETDADADAQSLWGSTSTSTESRSRSRSRGNTLRTSQIEAVLANALERINALELRLARGGRDGIDEERREGDGMGEGRRLQRFAGEALVWGMRRPQPQPTLLPSYPQSHPQPLHRHSPSQHTLPPHQPTPTKSEHDLEAGGEQLQLDIIRRQEKAEKQRREVIALLLGMIFVMGAVGWWVFQIVRAKYSYGSIQE